MEIDRQRAVEQAEIAAREETEKARMAQTLILTQTRIRGEEDVRRREIARQQGLDEAEIAAREATERLRIAAGGQDLRIRASSEDSAHPGAGDRAAAGGRGGRDRGRPRPSMRPASRARRALPPSGSKPSWPPDQRRSPATRRSRPPTSHGVKASSGRRIAAELKLEQERIASQQTPRSDRHRSASARWRRPRKARARRPRIEKGRDARPRKPSPPRPVDRAGIRSRPPKSQREKAVEAAKVERAPVAGAARDRPRPGAARSRNREPRGYRARPRSPPSAGSTKSASAHETERRRLEVEREKRGRDGPDGQGHHALPQVARGIGGPARCRFGARQCGRRRGADHDGARDRSRQPAQEHRRAVGGKGCRRNARSRPAPRRCGSPSRPRRSSLINEAENVLTDPARVSRCSAASCWSMSKASSLHP